MPLRTNQISPLNFRAFSFRITLVCLLQIQQTIGIECGTVSFLADIPTERIFKGTVTRPNEWPFIAALYFNNGSEYMCGGTIISVRHILTAAHCIQAKGVEKKREIWDIRVRLGAHNLTVKDEKGVVQSNITEIHVHPDWDANNDNYDADLAILELSANVVFTDYIRPICLPEWDAYVDGATVDIGGVIVGWGLDQNKIHEEIPKETDIQALNDSYCYRSNVGIVSLSSARTFCGIGVGTPNRGDSGGGFLVDIDFVWRQYGIISSIRTNKAAQVDSNVASVYTNVQAFRDWIVETVAKSGIVVGGIDLRCDYETIIDNNTTRYECHLFDLDIRGENMVLESFTGTHEEGRTDQNVERIVFVNGTMASFPNGMGNFFRNLKELVAYTNDSTLGPKSIRRSDFQNIEKINNLYFVGNGIETVDADALWDLPNLEILLLRENKLKQLHETTFEKNIKLHTVILDHNKLENLPRNLFRHNVALSLVKLNYNRIKIIDTDFTELKNIRYIELYKNICISAYLYQYDTVSELQNDIRIKCNGSDAEPISESFFAKVGNYFSKLLKS